MQSGGVGEQNFINQFLLRIKNNEVKIKKKPNKNMQIEKELKLKNIKIIK